MEMSNEEIIRRYKQAKHKASQIQILAELNACPKSKILEIVSDSIVPKHPVPAQHKEQPEPVKAVDNLASFEEYVVNRMDEIDGQLKALEEVQKYRKIGTVEECREAVEKQKKGLSVDEAKRIAAKAICIGCVKGGMGYWNRIRRDFPEVFESRAQLERLVGYSILKESDGTPLYLDELDPNRGDMNTEIFPDCGIMCYLAQK